MDIDELIEDININGIIETGSYAKMTDEANKNAAYNIESLPINKRSELNVINTILQTAGVK